MAVAAGCARARGVPGVPLGGSRGAWRHVSIALRIYTSTMLSTRTMHSKVLRVRRLPGARKAGLGKGSTHEHPSACRCCAGSGTARSVIAHSTKLDQVSLARPLISQRHQHLCPAVSSSLDEFEIGDWHGWMTAWHPLSWAAKKNV